MMKMKGVDPPHPVPVIYLASPVFRLMAENSMVSASRRERIKELFHTIESSFILVESGKRFPSPDEIRKAVTEKGVNIIGCHLSHTIDEKITSLDSVRAICTATAGYNHIDISSEPEEGRGASPLITHTPSVLHNAVSDFIISLIFAHLKNVPKLNRFVFDGKWKKDSLWDMDLFLGKSISSLTVGIVGLGEIGSALAEKLSQWNVKILYHSRRRKPEIEKRVTGLIYSEDIRDIFRNADIVSLNVALTSATKHLADREMLSLMKPGALLVNTSRGSVVDMEALLELLESGGISINLASDVFDPEPVSDEILGRFRKLAEIREDLNFILMPHTASSDADTRADMVIMMLEDITSIARSLAADRVVSEKCIEKIHLIPEQSERK